ncbi:MAG: ABC transporter substrate-binding protein [Oscillospiraceae bacterium]|jgi:iron(III) transport system substrate-binding protein|nr:ABC transporter substrate-binding protein [Oscillospiraceae bacterium]MCI9587252.1 ABC transporter substrate-binding protein [Oscillospiraceae bacterium]
MIMVLSLLVGCSGGNNNSGSNNDRQNDANTPSDSNTDNNNTEQTYSGKVMLYSSMQEDQLMAIKEGFEKKYPGVTMEYYFAGTSKVVTKISTEAQAGHVDADVIWVGDAADYVSFKEEGILQQYTSPEAAGLDPNYIDAEGYYTAARLVGVGIAYNTVTVKPEDAPKTWSDLLDPKWKDQIVMSDPGTAGTTKYWMNAMMCSDKYGADYMQKLKDNGCLLESGTTATHNQLAAQAYQVGVCLDYVTANLVAEGSPIAFLYPEDTVSIASPIGLVKDCNNEENGKLLYDFILSKEGQEILVANNLVSVRSDVEQSVDLSAIPSILECDFAKLASDSGSNLENFNKIFGLS